MYLRKDPRSEDSVNNIKLKEKSGNKDFATSLPSSVFQCMQLINVASKWLIHSH